MPAAQVKAGDIVAGGKYAVERVLGTGGMGMVVAARHLELDQRVALKFMLREAMADPSNVERFAREARAAVRLQSPHTVRVLDVGRLKSGEPYMVMEYLDGHDLDEVLQRDGPMQPQMAVGYVLQACEAFAEAHGLGMIHRDIKLKNLFLTRMLSGRALVKVLDFGLAKTAGAIGDVSLTKTSAIFGSPQYMSPEQLRSAKDVDSRSDLWAIGVCLYELLTGRVPFDADGVAEICAMVLKDPVEPPSRWARHLPPELDAVLVRCLEKDPNHRYQTVQELAKALEPWGAPSSSRGRPLLPALEPADLATVLDPRPDFRTTTEPMARTVTEARSDRPTFIKPKRDLPTLVNPKAKLAALPDAVSTGALVDHNTVNPLEAWAAGVLARVRELWAGVLARVHKKHLYAAGIAAAVGMGTVGSLLFGAASFRTLRGGRSATESVAPTREPPKAVEAAPVEAAPAEVAPLPAEYEDSTEAAAVPAAEPTATGITSAKAPPAPAAPGVRSPPRPAMQQARPIAPKRPRPLDGWNR